MDIIENPIATEGKDYFILDIMSNKRGPNLQDAALTIEFAKKLCMTTKSEVGKRVNKTLKGC